MKPIILCLCLFIFIRTEAQQINPVPDYVFSNKMSVGRNAVTDTAAYFSIGPRYGAIRGMMPPMVTDTANMSATKRNGLLIFSIQKNKYLYWDSVGSKWAEMAGTAGSAITGSGVAGYMPEFTTTTNLDTTRLYHSAGRFAIGSTTTTNGVFNVIGGTTYLEGNLSFGAADRTISNISNNVLAFGTNNTERMRLKADGELLIGTTTDAGAYALQVAGAIYNTTGAVLAASSGDVGIGTTLPNRSGAGKALSINGENVAFELNRGDARTALIYTEGTTVRFNSVTNIPLHFGTNNIERVRITTDGNFGINTTTPSRKLHVVHNAEPVALFSGAGISTDQNNGGAFIGVQNTNATNGNMEGFSFTNSNGTPSAAIIGYNVSHTTGEGILAFGTRNSGGTYVEGFRLSSSQEVLIGATADAGAYALQVAGSIYNTTGAVLAASSGNVGIGTASPSTKLHVYTDASNESRIRGGSMTLSAFRISSALSDFEDNAGLVINTTANDGYKVGISMTSQYFGAIQSYNTQGSPTVARNLTLNPYGGEVLIGTTTDDGAYALQVSGAIYNTTTITTGAPTSGSAKPWRLGEAATVSPTSPNRTIRVEIDGTVYYIHAKTTND